MKTNETKATLVIVDAEGTTTHSVSYTDVTVEAHTVKVGKKMKMIPTQERRAVCFLDSNGAVDFGATFQWDETARVWRGLGEGDIPDGSSAMFVEERILTKADVTLSSVDHRVYVTATGEVLGRILFDWSTVRYIANALVRDGFSYIGSYRTSDEAMDAVLASAVRRNV